MSGFDFRCSKRRVVWLIVGLFDFLMYCIPYMFLYVRSNGELLDIIIEAWIADLCLTSSIPLSQMILEHSYAFHY